MNKIYLCGPINGCSDDDCKSWREQFKDLHSDCLDPMVRDYRGIELENYREIVELDKLDLRLADILVVYYNKPSVGTSMEILYAWQMGKPVVTIIATEDKISPWLIYHSTCLVKSVEEAYKKCCIIMGHQ